MDSESFIYETQVSSVTKDVTLVLCSVYQTKMLFLQI